MNKTLPTLTAAQQRLLFDAYDHEVRGRASHWFPVHRRVRSAEALAGLGLCWVEDRHDSYGRMRTHIFLEDAARRYAHYRDPKILKTKLTAAQFALLRNAVYGVGAVGRRVRSAKALEALGLGTTDSGVFLPSDLGKAVAEAPDWSTFKCPCRHCNPPPSWFGARRPS